MSKPNNSKEVNVDLHKIKKQELLSNKKEVGLDRQTAEHFKKPEKLNGTKELDIEQQREPCIQVEDKEGNPWNHRFRFIFGMGAVCLLVGLFLLLTHLTREDEDEEVEEDLFGLDEFSVDC